MDPIEEYEERKRLRRSRFRWRLIALIAVIAAAAAYISQMQGPQGKHLARYAVTGIIVDDPDRDALMRNIADKESVEALIVQIDSPGGTVAGSEALYETLRTVSEEKPVVAVMREVAASGGYITALAADHIVARGNTITGSVGVVFNAPNAHELMDRLGVQMVEIKSGPLKAQPSPFKPVDPEVIEAEQALIEDSFKWFLGLVEERRGLKGNTLRSIADGGVFTGRQAQEIGLIDSIGGEEAAIAWLEAEKSVSSDIDVIDYEVGEENETLIDLLLKQIGISRGDRSVLRRAFAPGLHALYR